VELRAAAGRLNDLALELTTRGLLVTVKVWLTGGGGNDQSCPILSVKVFTEIK
jgi:hypothetical protein